MMMNVEGLAKKKKILFPFSKDICWILHITLAEGHKLCLTGDCLQKLLFSIFFFFWRERARERESHSLSLIESWQLERVQKGLRDYCTKNFSHKQARRHLSGLTTFFGLVVPGTNTLLFRIVFLGSGFLSFPNSAGVWQCLFVSSAIGLIKLSNYITKDSQVWKKSSLALLLRETDKCSKA